MIKLTYDCRPSIGQRKNDMKTIKWTRWSSVSRRGVFFYTGAFEDVRYWICKSWKTAKWGVEDNCGAVWGSFDTAQQARKAVEIL